MRSEFFNQVKQNRQRFYLQLDQIKKEEASPLYEVSIVDIESQKGPVFSLPQLNIKIPEIQFANGFKKLRAFVKQVYVFSKPYGLKFLRILVGHASVIGKEVNKGYTKITGVVSKYAEIFQMFIFTNLIVLFEDDPDNRSDLLLKSSDTKNRPDQPYTQENAGRQNEVNKDNTMSNWFSRIFGKIIIGLELDDLQLSAVKIPIDKSEDDILVIVNKKSYPIIITSKFLDLKNQLAGLLSTINPVKVLRRDYAEINKFL